MKYNAFISYSHAADGKLAPALQNAFHRIAKPVFKFRALNIFRDETSLSATPSLWKDIENALRESQYLILLASPTAAKSLWVQKEVEFWLANRSIDTLLIGLTKGEIVWNENDNDFNWDKTNSLPETLKGKFVMEPLFVDLRPFKNKEDLSFDNPDFKKKAAILAAAIHGKGINDLIGEDVQQRKKTLRLAYGSIAALIILLIGLLWFAREALVNLEVANNQSALATERGDSLAYQLQVSNELRNLSRVKGDSLNQQLLISNLLTASESRARLQAEQSAQMAKDSADYARLQQLIAQGETRKAKAANLVAQANLAYERGDFKSALLLAAYAWKYDNNKEIFGALNKIAYDQVFSLGNKTYASPIPTLLEIFPNYFDTRPHFSPDGHFVYTCNDNKNETTIIDFKNNTRKSLEGANCVFSPNAQFIRTYNRATKYNYLWTKEGLLLDSIGNRIFEFSDDSSKGYALPYDRESKDTEIYDFDSRSRRTLTGIHIPNEAYITFSALEDPDNSYLTNTYGRGRLQRKYRGQSGDFSPSGQLVFTKVRDEVESVVYHKNGREVAVVPGVNLVFSQNEDYVAGASRKRNKSAIWQLPTGDEVEVVNGSLPKLNPDGSAFYTFDISSNTSYLWTFEGLKIRDVRGEYKTSFNQLNYGVFYNRSDNNTVVVNTRGENVLKLNGELVDLSPSEDAITTVVNERRGEFYLWNLKDNPIIQIRGEIAGLTNQNHLLLNYENSKSDQKTIIANIDGKVLRTLDGRFLKMLNDSTIATIDKNIITLWDKRYNKIGNFAGVNITAGPEGKYFIDNFDKGTILANNVPVNSFPIKYPEMYFFGNRLVQNDGHQNDEVVVYSLTGEVLRRLEGRKPDIFPNHDRLITIDLYNTYLWDTSFRKIATIPGAYHTTSLCSPDGSFFFTPINHDRYVLRDINGSVIDTASLPGGHPQVSKNAAFIFAYDEIGDSESFGWDIKRRKVINFYSGIKPKLSPRGSFCVTSSTVENKSFLWDKTGKLITAFYGVKPFFTADEKYLITYSTIDEKSHVWPISPAYHIRKIFEKGIDLNENTKSLYGIEIDLE